MVLDKYIFLGLQNLNDGFDSDSIKYFSESDFSIVLKRAEENKIGILGIEPWPNGEFYNVLTYEDYSKVPDDPNWYWKAFEEFKKSGKQLQYSASYFVPPKNQPTLLTKLLKPLRFLKANK